MQPKTRKRVWLIGVPLVVVAGTAGFIWGGVYNVAADDMHTKPVHFLLETARERSIVARLGQLDVPSDLDDRTRIVQGAGNYAAMCTGCHLAPSMAETELSQGLYPTPPDLSKHKVDVAKAFWVIKHGIKASGMPVRRLGSMQERPSQRSEVTATPYLPRRWRILWISTSAQQP